MYASQYAHYAYQYQQYDQYQNNNMLKFVILLSILVIANSLLNPSQFSAQLQKAAPKNMTILHQDLGRTINGYSLMAYGLTLIPGIPTKYQLSDFHYYPSYLITSYMHSSDENAVNLLYGFVTHIFRKLNEKDYYFENVLSNGILWLVPYINIDAYESLRKTNNSNNNELRMPNKNMNKYPDPEQLSKNCEKLDPTQSSGVDINYNFLKQIGQQYNDLCNENYAGPSPFSERETLGIRKLFDNLKITTVIDLQIGNNYWIYPDIQVWNNHTYKLIYKDVIKKTQGMRFFIKPEFNMFQNNKQNSSEPQKISGGFINWAGLQGALAFKYLITSDVTPQLIRMSLSSAFPVMEMIIKKNAPLYNKYRSHDNKKIYIQSISLNEFSMRSELVVKGMETITKDYQIGVSQVVEISVHIDETYYKNMNKDMIYRPMPQIRLYVVGTLIAEVVDMQKLPYIDSLAAKNKSNEVTEEQHYRNLLAGGFVIFVMLIMMCLPIVLSRFDKKSQGYQQVEQHSASTRQ